MEKRMKTVLRRGSRGQEVRELQEMLKNFGFYTAGVDGIFGGKTELAVSRFQKLAGLLVDGIVGKNTWAMLGNVYVPTGSMKSSEVYEASANGFLSYTTKPSDSIWSLAQNFDTTVDCIMKMNKLESMNISGGQALIIPVGDRACAIATNNEQRTVNNYGGNPTDFNETDLKETPEMEAPMPVSDRYSVVYGDSLWKIAQMHGTTVDELKRLNGLNRDSLSIGQVLRIN